MIEAILMLFVGLFQLLFELVLVLLGSLGFAVDHLLKSPPEGEMRFSVKRLLTALAPLLILLLVFGFCIGGLQMKEWKREQRNQKTRELIATELRTIAAEVDKNGRFIRRAKGALSVRDAWGHRLTVVYRDNLLNETVEVRSDGDDGKPGTFDDLKASHSLLRKKREVAKDVLTGAAKLVRDKLSAK